MGRKHSPSVNVVLGVLEDRPVMYRPDVALALGGPNESIMVCQLMWWDGKGALPDGWVYKSREDWTKETGLSRYQQEAARKKLRALGVWEEELRGMPAILHYRLLLPELVEKLVEYYEEKDAPSRGENHQQAGGKTTNKLGGKPPTLIESESTAESTTRDFSDVDQWLEEQEAGKEPPPRRSAEEALASLAETAERALRARGDFAAYPEDVRPILRAVRDVWRMDVWDGPDARGTQYTNVLQWGRDLHKAAGPYGPAALMATRASFYDHLVRNDGIAPYTVKDGRSLIGVVTASVKNWKTLEMPPAKVKADAIELMSSAEAFWAKRTRDLAPLEVE